MDTSQKETFEKKLQIMWILWGAMALSLVIYILICQLFGDRVRKPMGLEFPLELLRNILFGISTVALIATRFVRRFILGRPSGGPSPVMPSPPSQKDPSTLLAKYTTAMIISLALCESVGIYGLVLFLLGDSLQTLYSFMVISAAAIFYYRPKREEIEALFYES